MHRGLVSSLEEPRALSRLLMVQEGAIVDNVECGLAGVCGGGREQSETPYRINVLLSLWSLPELRCSEWVKNSIMRGRRRGVLLEHEDKREHLKLLKILALI